MSAVSKLTFDGKPVDLKFDNFALFNFVSKGVGLTDLLISKDAEADNFCRAWAAALEVEYDGNARAFMKRFNPLTKINDTVINALETSGMINPEESSSKKNKRR